MPSRLSAGLAAASLLLLTSCSIVSGSGTLKTESRPVSGFTKVAFSGAGDLTIEQSGTESLSIEAEDNLLPLLTSDVSGDTLTLGTKRNANMRHTLPITYRLGVKDLTGIDLSGSGTVVGAAITTRQLTIEISGSGKITLGGSAANQVVTISGSGEYAAGELASKTVAASISGSGDATVQVSQALTANITGSGHLTYIGDPTVTKDISGSGDLSKR